MTAVLDQLLDRLREMPPAQKAALTKEVMTATKDMKFIPNPGPQRDAYYSKADLLLFGGSGGGGKSSLLNGLAISAHRRSLIVRRRYTDLSNLTEEIIKMNGTRDGFNASPPPTLRTKDGRVIEYGAAANIGDEEAWQGRPHDFFGADEVVHFAESQIRFFLGWLRSIEPGQRTRAVLASNPPITAEGQWIIPMFRPWLDITHPNPAKPGELRWFVRAPDDKDIEVDGPTPVEMAGMTLIPQSRTFIPAALADNPFLANTDYKAKLDALPEPLRSAVRDGNFMAARQDSEWQCIPTDWVRQAMKRWTPKPPQGVPMSALGVDPAAGGADTTTLSPRYDWWFAPLIQVPGAQTPLGTDVAGLVVSHRRGNACVVLDMGGGYGGGPYDHLVANNIEVMSWKGSETSVRRSKDKQLKFYNKRAQAYWQFREALDPSQEGGSPIALPDDPELISDLTAPMFEVGTRGIKITPKEDLVEKLGRSPDKGDAVVMAWQGGPKNVLIFRPGLKPEQMSSAMHAAGAGSRPVRLSRKPSGRR